jgi:anti-repressor protein
MYSLDKRLSLVLATGYNVVWRTKIIDRWEELEREKAMTTHSLPQTFAQALLLASKQAEEIERLEEIRAIEAPLVEFARTVQTIDSEVSMEQFAKATFDKF